MTTKDKKEGQDLTGAQLDEGMRGLVKAAVGRLGVLLDKAKDGTITDAERDEMMKSLQLQKSGGMQASAAEPLNKSQAVKDTIDVSDYIRDTHIGMMKSLDGLAGGVDTFQKGQHDFNKALSQVTMGLVKAYQAQGEELKAATTLIKSLGEKIDQLMGQPARGPRAVTPGVAPQARTIAAPIAPSGGGGGPQDSPLAGLSKAQVADAMSDLIEKGVKTLAGEDLLSASTQFELYGEMTKSLATELKKSKFPQHSAAAA